MKPPTSLENFTPTSIAFVSPLSAFCGTVTSWFHRLVQGQRLGPTVTAAPAEGASILPLSSVARLWMIAEPVAPGVQS